MVEAHRVDQCSAIEAIDVQVKIQRFRLQRPAGVEAPLDTTAHGPAQSILGQFDTRADEVVLYPRNMTTACKAAGCVDQCRTPGAADPEASSAKRFKSSPAGDEKNAGTGVDTAAEVSPSKVGFDTEHPGAGLPIESECAAKQAAARFVRYADPRCDKGPLQVGPSETALNTDVETGPVVEWSRGHHGRHGGRDGRSTEVGRTRETDWARQERARYC